MKKLLLIAGALLMGLMAMPNDARAQRNCGIGVYYQKLAVENPALLRQIREKQLKGTEEALAYAANPALHKTTAQYPIPVAFHFVVTQSQYSTLGRDSGIRRRVYSQLKGLNNDFNGANADKSLIPAAFLSRYANVGIQFGLAKATSAYTIGAGIEVLIVPNGTIYDVNDACLTAKQAGTTGLAAWDATKYFNIWVTEITTGGSGVILGVTTPPSYIGGFYNGSHEIQREEIGVVLNYGAVGVREFAAQSFRAGIDKGRTLTHEVGHFFELAHIWGDDDNSVSAGYCPGAVAGGNTVGFDDGIADTPPQARRTYCDYPNHSGSLCPTYPVLDACTPTGSGIMFMNYMDYVDDGAMQMFTTMQGALMRVRLSLEVASLTENPDLSTLGVASVRENTFTVWPNPATNAVHIVLDGADKLQSIDVVSMMGQSVAHLTGNGSTSYEVPLAGAARGIYFVQCHFTEGTITRKIVLQ